MSLRFLLDTNTVSEALKLQPNLEVIQKLQDCINEVAISSTTWHELWFGCYRLAMSKKRQKIEQYLRETIEINVPLLFYDAAAAEWFAKERARWRSGNLLPAPMVKLRLLLKLTILF